MLATLLCASGSPYRRYLSTKIKRPHYKERLPFKQVKYNFYQVFDDTVMKNSLQI